MKRLWVILLTVLLTSIQMSAQSSELFPRYTVVDVAPQVTGEKSLEQLQSEFQDQADKKLKGKVRVDFLVLPSGAIGDCRINYTLPDGNEDLAYEGKRFVASLPKFTPGVLNGDNVRTWSYVILNFGKVKKLEKQEYQSTLGVVFQSVEGNANTTNKEVEQMPSFPGGFYSLIDYLSNNIQYPEECLKQKIEGKVLVEFVVETNGSISSITVKQSVHPLLDDEARRVISAMPRWFPAIQDNEPVRVKYTVPITFRL